MSVRSGHPIHIAVYDPTETEDYGRDGPIGIRDLLIIHPTGEEQ